MKIPVRITEAEWEVMDVVWGRAPVPASTIAEVLEKKRRWTLATVRTLLRRLVNKGALEQSAEGKRFLYTPLVTRDTCAHQESQSFIERVLGRLPASALVHLVEQTDLSRDEIQELRRILRNKEKQS